jgi:tetratricopeptide (TPR) repeat protein
MLVAYPKRSQLLPTVASAVYRHLTEKQRQEQETLLIQAYSAWVQAGTFQEGDSEQGAVMTELAVLLLKHHRLLEAAEHVIRYGWMSFNLGHGSRLARLAKSVMQRFDWQGTPENECAGLLLQQVLFMFLGENVDAKWQEQYQRLRDAFLANEISLPSAAEQHLLHLLAMYTMNELRFEDAQILLDAYCTRLEARQVPHLDHRMPNEHAGLYSTWSEYAEEQGDMQKARELREQAIALYKHYSTLLANRTIPSPLKGSLYKKALAGCFNNISYYLSRNGQHEEALQYAERSITLMEQGYGYFGALAASYGSKSEILLELGRFQEALRFDEQALTEIQRCADTGYALSRDEVWVYKVSRGRLYLRLGRIAEAEHLLREALPHIRPERRMYRMFADNSLEEIEQWRQHAPSAQHQVDWRWVERYRELNAYDGHGWLAHAGPFTAEEQQQWDALLPSRAQQAVKEQLGTLITQSRERELTAAVAEQREPRLHYPALEIEEVRRRIAALLHLETEITHQEPNAVIRHLYHGVIEEEVTFLRMIEATYEGNTEHYWACNLRLDPVPTPEDVEYALSHVKRAVLQGLQRPETAEVSQRLRTFLQTRLHVLLDLPSGVQESEEQRWEASSSSAPSKRTISTQAAKRFFEAVLAESGYDEWRVVIDTAATNPRVEIGMRVFFLCDRSFSLEEIRHWLAHEIAGHAARAIAGERSPLGLLGIDTQGNLATEEGLTLYHERRIATLHGHTFQEEGIWLGSLTTGLASGVLTPPQTFLWLYRFLELYSLLGQLLEHPDADVQKMQQRAQKHALQLCLRTYRGVPDLNRAGVCYLKDSVYLRGLRMIERAVAADETVLDRLAVGRVALEHLSQMQELSIVSAPQSLLHLAYDPQIDARIVSFEERSEESSR